MSSKQLCNPVHKNNKSLPRLKSSSVGHLQIINQMTLCKESLKPIYSTPEPDYSALPVIDPKKIRLIHKEISTEPRIRSIANLSR